MLEEQHTAGTVYAIYVSVNVAVGISPYCNKVMYD